MTRARVVIVAAMLTAVQVPLASAQTALPPGRLELSAGFTWMGESNLGAVDANLTTGNSGTARFFSTSSTLGASTGLEARAGVRVWRALEAEAFVSYTKPVLSIDVSNDTEGAAPATAAETIRQYIVGGGALYYLPFHLAGGRLVTFISGSAAYLRQLHEGDTLAVTGRTYDGGIGAKYFLVSRPAGRLNAFGIRADARAQARVRGVALDDFAHFRPALSAAAFVRF